MKTLLTTVILIALLIASAIVGYNAAHSWDNLFLANCSIAFFTLFWIAILYLSVKVCPKDNPK